MINLPYKFRVVRPARKPHSGRAICAPVFSRDMDAELAHHDIPTYLRRKVVRLDAQRKHEEAERLRKYIARAQAHSEQGSAA